ncbi:YadA C-terminal domain-containing protein [Enterobacter cloacae complex sp. P31C]|uniref:YadA C-terminal domain-containing protein n=1 Tax=Enterobacter TaxID=547 RepID=UPI00272DE465|nr:YadA-like family protein [Enterobacter cloacae complex sp. P31C]
MKYLNKSFISVVVGIVVGGVINTAGAANMVWDDAYISYIVNDHQDQIAQNKVDSITRDLSIENHLTQVDSDLQSTKLGVLVLEQATNDANQKALLAGALADTANQTAAIALQESAKNGSDIIDLQQQTQQQGSVLTDHDRRITSLENAPKPTNGVDGKDGAKGDKGDTGATGAQGVAGINGRDGANGKDGQDGAKGDKGDTGATGAQGVAGINGRDGANGKDGQDGKDGKNGVMTTVTRTQVDTATQAKVATNSQAVTAEAQELLATKQTLQALNNNTNQQFKSLREEVDNNKKEANAGISGAMAMAGLPQVQTNQRVMFSAGGATYNGESALAVGASVNFNEHMIGKVSFSDDTANNMGASVGVGIGF